MPDDGCGTPRTGGLGYAIVRFPLPNEVAVVTGASRGIGRAIALRLAAAGCRVAAVARNAPALEAAVEASRPLATHPLTPFPCDVTDDAAAEAMIRAVLERMGRIGVLVSAAGVAFPRREVSRARVLEWDAVLATCLRAPMILSRLVLPDMLAHERGAIVHIVSTAAFGARPGEAAYAAAKAGLLAFSRALFAETRNRGVKVVAVCPDLVDTELVPPNRRYDRARFLQPADVADMVLHLLDTPVRACPTELVIEPQYDPSAPRRG